MLRILELLDKSRGVKSYELLDFKQGMDFHFLKVKAELENDTSLHIKVYISEKEYDYSYHWQDKDGKLIIRWDNSPQHRELRTYPHHKHISGRIEESSEIDLGNVLKEIEESLETK